MVSLDATAPRYLDVNDTPTHIFSSSFNTNYFTDLIGYMITPNVSFKKAGVDDSFFGTPLSVIIRDHP